MNVSKIEKFGFASGSILALAGAVVIPVAQTKVVAQRFAEVGRQALLYSGVAFAVGGGSTLIGLGVKQACKKHPTTSPLPQNEPQQTPASPGVASGICASRAPLQDEARLLGIGSQAGCSGPVDSAAYRALAAELNEKAPAGIRFDPDPDEDRIVGGTCTAMSLRFLAGYLSSGRSPEAFYTRAQESFSRSQQEDRNLQEVLNNIDQEEGVFIEDVLRVQIDASMRSKDLQVVSATETLTKSQVATAATQIDALSEGVHVLRFWEPIEHRPIAPHGHTLALVKRSNGVYLYEPNSGLHYASRGQGLLRVLRGQFTRWPFLSHFCFYSVAPVN